MYHTITGIVVLDLGLNGGKNQSEEFTSSAVVLHGRENTPATHTPTEAQGRWRTPMVGGWVSVVAEPLPQPSRSLVINGVAVEEVISAGAGIHWQTSGIWKHVV